MIVIFIAGKRAGRCIIMARRRWSTAREQRLARWESLVDPKDWPKIEIDLNAVRLQKLTTFAQIAGGAALLVGIYFTYQNLGATRDSEITDRFIRAIDQLGKTDDKGAPVREVRLGGIYGLRRIAQNSAEDYKPVREILNDYVRLNAPWPPQVQNTEARQIPELPNVSVGVRNDSSANADSLPNATSSPEPHPETDIQAALDFLQVPIEKFEKVPQTTINLPNTDLRGADLQSAKLDLANLSGAHLERADLDTADLTGAHLNGAHLSGADFFFARLDGADLSDADLDNSIFRVTDLSKTVGLTQEQIDSAIGDASTELPTALSTPASWKRK